MRRFAAALVTGAEPGSGARAPDEDDDCAGAARGPARPAPPRSLCGHRSARPARAATRVAPEASPRGTDVRRSGLLCCDSPGAGARGRRSVAAAWGRAGTGSGRGSAQDCVGVLGGSRAGTAALALCFCKLTENDGSCSLTSEFYGHENRASKKL